MKRLTITLLWAALIGWGAGPAAAAQVMTRTLKGKPAIVLTAFGTSTRAQRTYERLDAAARAAFPEHTVRWAFTSEVIREKVNSRRRREGDPELLASLQQALANLEAEGYTKVVVQPLHIFPGEEYEEVVATTRGFPGLKVELGETLLQRWETVHEVVALLGEDFLRPEEGCNVIVAHGTPQTHIGSNVALLGLDRYLSRRFDNVYLGGVDGIVTRADALEPAKRCTPPRVRFIPLMYVAGDHIMNDIMGEREAGGKISWKTELADAGIVTETLTVQIGEETYYRGLGFLDPVNQVFMREIQRALDRL